MGTFQVTCIFDLFVKYSIKYFIFDQLYKNINAFFIEENVYDIQLINNSVLRNVIVIDYQFDNVSSRWIKSVIDFWILKTEQKYEKQNKSIKTKQFITIESFINLMHDFDGENFFIQRMHCIVSLILMLC